MKKFLNLFALVLFVLAAPAFAEEKSAAKTEPFGHVTAEELQKLIETEKGLTVIDSRGGKYFDGEVIKGAKNLSVKDTNAESLAKLLPAKDTKVVFYCQNPECPASELAAYKAAAAGYTNVHKYSGGIDEWKKKGLPTEKLAGAAPAESEKKGDAKEAPKDGAKE